MSDLQPHFDLGGYVLDTIDIAERKSFEEHLLLCEQCQLDVQQLTDLKTMLADLMAEPIGPPPADLKDRTVAAVRAEASAIGREGPTPRTDLRWPFVALTALLVLAVLLLIVVAV